MLGKIFKAAGRAAVFVRLCTAGALLVLSAASAELFAKRARIRGGKLSGDAYIVGKKSDPKAVYVTNISPIKSAIYVIKRYFNG